MTVCLGDVDERRPPSWDSPKSWRETKWQYMGA
jgi:hypothetical protein